jgi:hypothetical protein
MTKFPKAAIAPLVVALWLLFLGSAHAAGEPGCPTRWGAPGKSLVTNAETARSIFLAVEKDFFPGADRQGFPSVEAEDEGAYWSVSRSRPSVTLPNGHFEITHGGGSYS